MSLNNPSQANWDDVLSEKEDLLEGVSFCGNKIISNYISDLGTKQFLLKNLYWHGEKLAWRFNLNSITKNIENVGEEILSPTPFAKPTLFIRGEKSHYVLDDDLASIQKLFPQSKIETIKNAGHWVHADNLKDMMEVCTRFLIE